MAPTTRSTANSPRTRSSDLPSSISTNTTSPSPKRKTPCCTKCHLPRAGHPRQGCPNVPASPPPQARSAPASSSRKPDSRALARALGSLYIDVPPRVKTKTTSPIRRPRRSAVEREPVCGDDDDDDEDDGYTNGRSAGSSAAVEGLLTGIGEGVFSAPGRSAGSNRSREPMPGSMGTPWTSFNGSGLKAEEISSPDGSELSPDSSQSTEPVASQTTQPASTSKRSSSSAPPKKHPSPRALARSYSSQEREAFLSALTRTGAPITYVLPKAEVAEIRRAAMEVKFHTRETPHISGGMVWVVLGKEEQAVEELVETLQVLKKKSGENGKGNLAKVAGGAVVGAVATFTGLAFA